MNWLKHQNHFNHSNLKHKKARLDTTTARGFLSEDSPDHQLGSNSFP